MPACSGALGARCGAGPRLKCSDAFSAVHLWAEGYRRQSSSASRFTAAQAGFSLLIQCGERPATRSPQALILQACANTSGPSSCSRRSFQPQPRRRASEQAAEHSLAYRERVPAKIVAVEFDQERPHEHIPVMASIADAVERRDPVFGPRSCSVLSSARRNQAAASAWSNPHTGGNRFDKISKVIR